MHETAITLRHLTRLRQIHRSSDWPCRDMVEVDLQVAGLIEARVDGHGHETLALTPAGLEALLQSHANNRASRSAHETLVMRVAAMAQLQGRIAGTGLALRTQF